MEDGVEGGGESWGETVAGKARGTPGPGMSCACSISAGRLRNSGAEDVMS